MAYIGIGNAGDNDLFLREQVNANMGWLKGDRLPHFFGDRFVVLYDSNTAREFVRKCLANAPENSLLVYPMDRPLDKQPSTHP
jgi:hypothetical protein